MIPGLERRLEAEQLHVPHGARELVAELAPLLQLISMYCAWLRKVGGA